MNIEILSTGEELLSGAVTDTNSAFIAQKCIEKGYDILRHTTVGDDFNTLVTVFKEISERSEIAIISGGLGPTSDDRSAEAAAAAAGMELKSNPDAVASVQAYFEKFGRAMSVSDIKQTMIPETSDCIVNPVGTAPGFTIMIGKCRFFFVPGVPGEMKYLLDKSILPAIDSFSGKIQKRVLRQSFFLFGLPEAAVNEKMNKLNETAPDVIAGFRADFPVIEVKLLLKSTGKDDEKQFRNAVKWTIEQFGTYIFSYEDGRIEKVVGELLRINGKTLAVAESCTGGLIGHKITAVAGSSDYFLTSCVTYANKAKTDILGVSPDTIRIYGAVSKETVREMAEGIRRISGADYAVATTGIAGPGGGTAEKPVGLVHIGIASSYKTETFEFISPFQSRGRNKVLFYIKTLDLLRKTLLDKCQYF